MDAHVIVKFRHFLFTGEGKQFKTIDPHLEMIKEKGKTWWGTHHTSISQERAESLISQIATGIPTYAFLYETAVPKSVHADTYQWYIAKIIGVSVGKPQNIENIPQYYRHMSCETYFLLSSIEPIKFNPGETPRVPGQASVRHIGIVGTPEPKNIVSLKDPGQKVCTTSAERSYEVSSLETYQEVSNQKTKVDQDLAMRVIELQDEVIELKDEISSLLSYKEYYNKIITADYLFSSEKFFETWIQDNFHKIMPECEIMDRQPVASWPDGKFGRLDLLAVNKETSDLVIIEVKTRKRSKSSGYDQFIRYVSWAKRNRELLSKKYADYKLMPSESPEFVIVTDYADDEMKAICRDHGIKLILVLGGISFEHAA
ncbi:MAG: hypothetical protein VKK42_32295 [Lyngbya sp.]|nr:hypothetical protein [Lyngbya sp.]